MSEDTAMPASARLGGAHGPLIDGGEKVSGRAEDTAVATGHRPR